MSYETLSEINPRLIMVRVSGYGQTGPMPKELASAQLEKQWVD